MLVDDGVLPQRRRHVGRRRRPERRRGPPTIAALIAARLDRLGLARSGRSWNEHRSSGGSSGAPRSASCSTTTARAELAPRLADLVRRELIRPDRATGFFTDAFRFRHALIRDAAYERSRRRNGRSSTSASRTGWSGRASNACRRSRPSSATTRSRRRDCGPSSVPLDGPYREAAVRGAGHLAAAGRRALARGDLPAAVGLLDRAAELLPPDEPGRASMLAALGSALTEQGDFARAADVFSGAEEAERQGGDVEEAYTSLTRLHLFFFTDPDGVAEATQREVERLIPLFEARGDELGLAKARRRLAMVYRTRRDIRSMEAELERAIVHARAAGDTREEARSLGLLATAAVHGSDPGRRRHRALSTYPRRGGRQPHRRACRAARPGRADARWPATSTARDSSWSSTAACATSWVCGSMPPRVPSWPAGSSCWPTSLATPKGR